jgi:stearoyl-CoA desaturase (delta-9 desaturase)
LFRELAARLDLRESRNWLAFSGWFWTLACLPFLLLFVFRYFSWPLLLAGFLYSMVGMGSFGTLWFHRYATHRAYTLRNRFSLFVVRNLFIKAVAEETYVISHHVHHALSDEAGDPYRASNGGLYCFLADTNHQLIARDLSEKDYAQVANMLEHTGVPINSYAQYQKWGSVSHPAWTTLHYVLNWSFWYGVFFLVGGHPLACALFGGAHVWSVGIRTFNFAGHGSGHDRRKAGTDFSTKDRSINQLWPGLVAGEWHSNHHVFPNGARAGFLRYQLDLPWHVIKAFHKLGLVTSYRDYKEQFLAKYYAPYLVEQGLSDQVRTNAATSASVEAAE